MQNARTQIRTATDAAALASAGVYASGGNGCATTDGTYVAANDSGATVTGCSLVAPSGTTPGR